MCVCWVCVYVCMREDDVKVNPPSHQHPTLPPGGCDGVRVQARQAMHVVRCRHRRVGDVGGVEGILGPGVMVMVVT